MLSLSSKCSKCNEVDAIDLNSYSVQAHEKGVRGLLVQKAAASGIKMKFW